METIITQQTSFRLREDLLEILKCKAQKANCCLNNFVESTLMEALCEIPNAETLQAMKEAQKDKYLNTLDVGNFKSYVESL